MMQGINDAVAHAVRMFEVLIVKGFCLFVCVIVVGMLFLMMNRASHKTRARKM